jgi:hypothetical protein
MICVVSGVSQPCVSKWLIVSDIWIFQCTLKCPYVDTCCWKNSRVQRNLLSTLYIVANRANNVTFNFAYLLDIYYWQWHFICVFKQVYIEQTSTWTYLIQHCGINKDRSFNLSDYSIAFRKTRVHRETEPSFPTAITNSFESWACSWNSPTFFWSKQAIFLVNTKCYAIHSRGPRVDNHRSTVPHYQ